MMPTFRQLIAMVWRSIRAPREGAAEVLSLGVPREATWLVIGLVAVLYTAFNQTTILILVRIYSGILDGYPDVATEYPEFVTMYEDMSRLADANVLVTAILQFLVLLATIFALHRIGQAFGGTGSLSETAILFSWFHFVTICAGAVLLGLLMLVPLLGLVGALPFAFLVLRMLIVFVASLHGFRSIHQAILTILLAYAAVAIVRVLLVGLLGVGAGFEAGET